MSKTVLILALGHGIPVALVGFIGWTRTPMYVTAAIMAIVAVVAGSPEYMVLDLLGVALGLYCGSKLHSYVQGESSPRVKPQQPPESPQQPRAKPVAASRTEGISEREAVSIADAAYATWRQRYDAQPRSDEAAYALRQMVRQHIKALLIEYRCDNNEALLELLSGTARNLYELMWDELIARDIGTPAQKARFLASFDKARAEAYEEEMEKVRAKYAGAAPPESPIQS